MHQAMANYNWEILGPTHVFETEEYTKSGYSCPSEQARAMTLMVPLGVYVHAFP